MHGGAAGSGAPRGQGNGAYRHGMHTEGMKAQRKAVRALIQEAKETLGWV